VSRAKPPVPQKPAVKPPVPTRAVTQYLPPWQTGAPAPVAAPVLADSAEPVATYDFAYVHPQTKAVRQLFVAEYVKDFNGVAALARLGLNYSAPGVVASRWLKEPFTQYLLARYVDEIDEDALINRKRVIAGLNREANSYGLDSSGASRVSAYGKLAKILGMEIDRSEVKVAVAGGIMLVPMGTSIDEWERNASRAQAELKQAASA